MKRAEKIAAESKWQRAKESVQRLKFRVQSSQTLLLLTDSVSSISIRQLKQTTKESAIISNLSAISFAVDFSQRIKEYIPENGLHPHSIWLKPVFDCNYSVRQLKLTAKDSAAKSNLSAPSFAVEFIQRIKEDTKREGNNEYRISKWSKQPGFLFLIYFLFVDEDNRIQHLRAGGSSGRAVYNIAQSITSCQLPVASRQQLLKENSTVFHIKPSAIGTFFPAEGCISESRAVRACLMIRVCNN